MATEPSITNLDQDEVRWARETPRAEKFIAGARLFDLATAINAAQIRKRHPDASEEDVLRILRERLEWASRWE
jgi:hypothetical protein